MLKELYEDLHRMRGDYKVNHNKCSVLVKDKAEGDAESWKTWEKIKMGDILEIKKNESFPTDLVLLYAEKEENVPADIIFIDTMNLDGETNLKPWK